MIDSDYRGPVFVLLFNHSDVDFTVEAGDRIAQLILEKVEYSEVVEVEVRSLFLYLLSGSEKCCDLKADLWFRRSILQELEETVRGSGGFGSTGGFGTAIAQVVEPVVAAVEGAVEKVGETVKAL